MTNLIIIGDQKPKEKKLKPIEFKFQDDGELGDSKRVSEFEPRDFKNVEVLCISQNKNIYYDIFFAYDNDRNHGLVFYGWYNDGVIEQ